MPVIGQSDLDGSPIDTIVIWTGLLSSIPTGWQTCDGTNGTPDLRDRFIKNVEDEFSSPGSTGGTTEETITLAKLPAHTHLAGGSFHNHQVEITNTTSGGGSNIYLGGGDVPPATLPSSSLTKTADPIQFQGGDQSHTNMPAFFEVIFIQRLT